jgi:hypothetical protein
MIQRTQVGTGCAQDLSAGREGRPRRSVDDAPGVSFKFNHVYVAKVDGALRDPRNGRVLIASVGKGKAFGEVSRGGKDDDREPINRAVRGVLNDLFDKLERDRRWEQL